MSDAVDSPPRPGGDDRPPRVTPRRRRRLARHRLRARKVVLAVGVAATAACGASTSTAPETAEVETAHAAAADTGGTTTGGSAGYAPVELTDVVYDEDPRRQILDVHVPAGDGPFPTILAIHGGRFKLNSKRLYDRHAAHFLERGVAFVATNYRFVPRHTHPAQVEDVHCALAWIHAHAEELGLDPSRIVVLGGSAGGYLAAMLATVDDHERYLSGCPHTLPDQPLAGAVTFYGIFDFIDITDYPGTNTAVFEGLWGTTHDQLSEDQLRDMSPIAQVDASDPPFLVIHGTRDATIPSVMSERFVDALEAAGGEAELLLVDAVHAFETARFVDPPNAESLEAIERFIAELP